MAGRVMNVSNEVCRVPLSYAAAAVRQSRLISVMAECAVVVGDVSTRAWRVECEQSALAATEAIMIMISSVLREIRPR
jgi:hypothetical protein